MARDIPKSGDAPLDHHLLPLWKYLTRDKLIEFQATEFGSVFLEFAGRSGFVHEKAPQFDHGYWSSLARKLAHLANQVFSEEAPTVSAKLPGGHRFELMMGRSVESGISVSIRVFRQLRFPIAAYGVGPDVEELIRDAFVNHRNVVVSGGTSSGKTTFLNSCAVHIPAGERVLTLEDVRELDIDHIRNRGHYLVDRTGKGLPVSVVFDHFMRSRPDRIICGELSVYTARSTAMFLSTGHRGFATTLHSNSCLEALTTAFHDRLELSGAHVNREHLTDYLRRNVDLVIQVARTPMGRVITEYWRPGIDSDPIQVNPYD